MKKTYFLFIIFLRLNYIASAQWIQINSPVANTLYDMKFINDSIGFCVGQDGVLKTNDFGNTWNLINSSPSGSSLFFVNDTIGYITTNNDLFKSIDFGNTWSLNHNFSPETPEGVFFTTADTGYLISAIYGPPGGSFIYKTMNGGVNWVRTDSFPAIPTLQSITFVNTDTGFVVGYSGQIIKTYNGGTTWIVNQIPSVETLISVYFPDEITGFAVGYSSFSGSEIIKTISSGNTWQQLPSGGTFNSALRSVYFPSIDTGYAVGEGGRIISTINGGASWQVSSPSIAQDFYSTFFVNNNMGFIMGTNGTILKTINGGIGGVFVGINNQINWPAKLNIFPNPAKNTIEINSLNECILRILNVEGGEKIKMQIKENKTIIDVSALESGIYFLQMISRNNVEVKKIIIE